MIYISFCPPSLLYCLSLSSSLLTAGRSGQIKEGYVILNVSIVFQGDQGDIVRVLVNSLSLLLLHAGE